MRAKSIKNKPRINEDPKDALLRKKQEELDILKAQIRQMAMGEIPSTSMKPGDSPMQQNVNYGNIKKKKTIDLSEMEKENLQVLEAKKNLAQNLKIKKEKYDN